MSFMQQQIYHGGYFAVDTTSGTEIVPDDLIGRTVGTHVEAFLNYLEGKPVDPEEVVEHKTGWLARMTAPGYLDCTDWTAHATETAAKAFLDDAYGDD